MRHGLARPGLTEADLAGVVRQVLAALDARSEVDAAIDLGAAVCVSLAGGWAAPGLTEEGVVIEVVPAGARPLSARVVYARSARSPAVRYVVQCWDRRVIREAAEIAVVSA